MIDALLPPHLAEIQRIEAGDTRMLARALLGLPPTPPLPDPLPEPPPVPITYLNSLAAILDREELTPADQRNLEGSLKQRLANPEERDAAVALLKRLRQHPSVTAFVAGEIDADLATIEPPAAPSPPPPPPSRPVPEYRNPSPAYASARPQSGGSRVGTVAALVLVVVLALGGLAVWLLASGGDDGNGGDSTDVSTQNEGSTGGGEGGTTGGGSRTTTTSRGTTTESTDNEVRPNTTEGGSAQP